MAVQVDQAGIKEILRAGAEDARTADLDTLRRKWALPNCDDPLVANKDATVWDHGVLVVHRDDGGALNQDSARRIPRCRLARLRPGRSGRQAAEQGDDERDPSPSSRCDSHCAPQTCPSPGVMA